MDISVLRDACEKNKSCHKNSSVINLISGRENGVLKPFAGKSEITKSYVQNLTVTKSCYVKERFQVPSNYNAFLRSSLKGSIFAVVKYENAMDMVYEINFSYSLPYSNRSNGNLSPPLLLYMLRTYKLQKWKILDTSDSIVNGKTYLLYTYNRKFGYGTAVRIELDDSYQSPELVWKFPNKVGCCTSYKYSDKYAVGCEEGFYIFNSEQTFKFHSSLKSVLSLQFTNNENVLYVSSHSDGLFESDIREPPLMPRRTTYRQSSEYPTKRCILDIDKIRAKEMTLLSDNISLVVTDVEGQIYKIDTRMRRTVFNYPGHIDYPGRRPFSLNEDLDLLCSAGNDNITRVWSLHSGKLLWSQKIVRRLDSEEPCHSLLIAKERRWFIAVVHIDAVFCVQNN